MNDGSIIEVDQRFILRAAGLLVADADRRGFELTSFREMLSQIATK